MYLWKSDRSFKDMIHDVFQPTPLIQTHGKASAIPKDVYDLMTNDPQLPAREYFLKKSDRLRNRATGSQDLKAFTPILWLEYESKIRL